MKSHTTQRFRKLYAALPGDIRKRAKAAYEQWQASPHHPSLHFARVHPTEPIYSARIGLHWRAVALVENDVAIWLWIGSHSDYDKLLDSL